MSTPKCVREPAAEEQAIAAAGLRSKDVFRLQQRQIIVAGARKEHVLGIARVLGCNGATVRNGGTGLAGLSKPTIAPHALGRTWAARSLQGVLGRFLLLLTGLPAAHRS